MHRFIRLNNKKIFPIILFFCFLIVPFIMYFDLMMKDMIFVNRDGMLSYGYRLFNQIAIEDGEFPFWNKYIGNGVPYASDIFGSYFIFNILTMVSPTVNIYFYYAFNVAVAGTYAYLFFNQVQCDKKVSIIAAVLYYFSIHLGGYRKEHTLVIAAMAYLPAVLYYTERLIGNNRIRESIYLALALMMPFIVGGHIQSIVYIYLVSVIYYFIRIFSEKKDIKTNFKYMVFAGLFYIGFSLFILLPAAEIFMYYSSHGAKNALYDYFKVYSINPFKFILAFIPEYFGNDMWEAFGVYQSSGFDLEIFSGTLVAIISVFGVIKFRKDKVLGAALFLMIFSWLYASSAHFPFLGKIIFRIPLLNAFRVPSRILFVFVFCNIVVFARTLTHLFQMREKEDFYKRYYGDFFRWYIVGVVASFVILGLNLVLIYDNIWLDRSEVPTIVRGVFRFVIVFSIITFLFYFARLKKWVYSKTMNYALGLIFIITLAEILPAYYAHRVSKLEEHHDRAVMNLLKEDINNYKIWSANTTIDPGYYSDRAVAFNLNLYDRVPSLNALLPVNNPSLFKLFTPNHESSLNSSGALAYYPNAEINLTTQNDLISMLGIKYIFDNEKLIDENEQIYIKNDQNENKLILFNKELILEAKDDINVWSQKVEIKEKTLYLLTLSVISNENPEILYVDFYGGDNYDRIAQDVQLKVGKGATSVSAIVNSGIIENVPEIFFRVVTNAKNNVVLKDLTIKELSTVPTKEVYRPFINNEEYRIFENLNAKDIFYIPKEVKQIESNMELYQNLYIYDLLNYAYVEDLKSFSADNAKLSNIIWKNNWASVDVESEEDTFVVFGQNYYPAWRVYVDGIRQELHMVNGIIQGVKVPAGKHYVKFQYFPKMQIMGGIILLLTLLTIVVLVVLKRKNIIKMEI